MASEVEKAIDLLNDVLLRKLNSMATYVLEASPHVEESERPLMEEIEAIAETERRHAEEAARRILELEGVPQGGCFDPSVADCNYLSLGYVAQQLLARLEQNIALFEQYRDRCDVLEAKDFFAMVLEEDLAHRDRLRELLGRLEAGRPGVETHLP